MRRSFRVRPANMRYSCISFLHCNASTPLQLWIERLSRRRLASVKRLRHPKIVIFHRHKRHIRHEPHYLLIFLGVARVTLL
jgi:hypothetical protein